MSRTVHFVPVFHFNQTPLLQCLVEYLYEEESISKKDSIKVLFMTGHTTIISSALPLYLGSHSRWQTNNPHPSQCRTMRAASLRHETPLKRRANLIHFAARTNISQRSYSKDEILRIWKCLRYILIFAGETHCFTNHCTVHTSWIYESYYSIRRSEWPRGLRHKIS
jgi:hypothetical protein